MKRRLKLFVYFALSLMMIVSILISAWPASASTTIGPLKDLNEGDTVQFSDQTWIVVSPDDGYLLLQGFYGYRPFDPDDTVVFDPSDSNNIAYYLNNDFYNSLDSADRALILPHSWGVGGPGNESSTTAGPCNIGLLSCNDWDIYKSFLNPNGINFWTLTPYYSVYHDGVYLAGSDSWFYSYSINNKNVRPALYLDPEIEVFGGNGGTVLGGKYTETVSVSASPSEGGTVTGGGRYAEGASVTVTATPASGYSFFNWTENGSVVSTDATYNFNITSNRILVANFSRIHSSDGGDNNSTTSPQTVSSTTGSATVNPAAGGTVSLGSDVSLRIPANALKGSDSLPVAVQRVDSPRTAPSGFMIMGTVYELTVNDQSHYSFNKPVTITFTFDPTRLAPGATPSVYYYDEDKGQWVNIGGTVSGNTITVTVDHFTKYAVMAAEKTAQTPVQKPSVTLTDISGHWAEKNIEVLVSLGVISGYPDGTFRPDSAITRAEFASILVKAFKLTPIQGKVFADTVNHWAKDSIFTATAYGIVDSYDENTFGPDDPVTREQMAVMAVKAAKLPLANEQTSFGDSTDISAWAREAVATVVKDKIMVGYSDNTFRPGATATRAEAVTIIVNALNK